MPLSFSPGEVFQFDWSHEHVELGGVMQTIKVAHFRLTCSRQGDRGLACGAAHDPGRQSWYSPLAILTALTLRAVFHLALRQTEGLIGSIIQLLGLALAVPGLCCMDPPECFQRLKAHLIGEPHG